MKIFSRAKKLFRRDGWRKLRKRIKRNLREKCAAKNLEKWIEADCLTDVRRENLHRQIAGFSNKPLFSIVMPVYNVEEKWLCLCIESVTNQIYANWELCIADDFSPSPHIKKVLEEYAARDERIKVVFRPENGHISAASNSALELATGEFVVLLDHDDQLAEDALFYAAKEINNFPETKMIYTDEDLIDETGRRYDLKFKPDWSRDLFYSVNYVTHLAIYKTEILQKIGGFRTGFEGSQDYDLALRVIEQISEKHIRHIPKMLYHWRAIKGSVAFSADEKPYAHERARQAIREHLQRTGKAATVGETVYNLHRVRYELPTDLPRISLILSAGEDFEFDEQVINNFAGQNAYENLEIVLLSKKNLRLPGSASFSSILPKVKFVGSENHSEAERLNFAVLQTSGEILCFADTNLKPLSEDWLKELASFANQKEIGAVGAKILDADESVLHAGLIVGGNATICTAYQGFPREFGGTLGRAKLVNNFSAVSISCLATRREVFDEIGGFDAENLPNKFFDADFCLKLNEKNLRVVFTPYTELVQINGKNFLNVQKTATAREHEIFRRKWQTIVEKDPFYNPNLSRQNADFSVEIRAKQFFKK